LCKGKLTLLPHNSCHLTSTKKKPFKKCGKEDTMDKEENLIRTLCRESCFEREILRKRYQRREEISKFLFGSEKVGGTRLAQEQEKRRDNCQQPTKLGEKLQTSPTTKGKKKGVSNKKETKTKKTQHTS